MTATSSTPSLENQLLPAAGLAVLRCNYAGSTSYGEAFTRRLYGNWHFPEAEDLLACLDEALRTRPWLDGDRLGVGGWSWGGIMSLWLVGHTDRFKVAVPERFSMDYLSAFGQDQWFPNYLAELGDPVRDAEKYRRHSPGTYLADVKTPLYLIANENDGNCPLPQAMQLYQRLRLRGVTTELVVYPGRIAQPVEALPPGGPPGAPPPLVRNAPPAPDHPLRPTIPRNAYPTNPQPPAAVAPTALLPPSPARVSPTPSLQLLRSAIGIRLTRSVPVDQRALPASAPG